MREFIVQVNQVDSFHDKIVFVYSEAGKVN